MSSDNPARAARDDQPYEAFNPDDPQQRDCLKCRARFESAWAGERICPTCKRSTSWKNASAYNGA